MKDREPLLATIVGEAYRLTAFGDIVDAIWRRIPQRYPDAELDDYVIMPNHVHGIIVINANQSDSVGAIHESPLRREYINQRRQITLSKIIGWFKMNTAKEINLKRGWAIEEENPMNIRL